MATTQPSSNSPPIGLIAAQGNLPVLIADGIHAAGREVACVGLAGQYVDQLPGHCDHFKPAGLIRIGRWIALLRRWGVSEAIMVGRVRKSRMYDPLAIARQMPDWRAFALWYRTLRHDRRTDAVLGAVANELQSAGITLIDSTRYIPEHMAAAGNMTSVPPSADQQADIDFGLPVVHRMGDLDIGQSIAVKDREVIAVEAIEGTDEMITRAGKLCRKGGWTLIKTGKPNQDMRFDVPTIGVQSITNLKAAGASCIAVETGKVILLDKPATLAAAEKAGIAIVGINLPGSAT